MNRVRRRFYLYFLLFKAEISGMCFLKYLCEYIEKEMKMSANPISKMGTKGWTYDFLVYVISHIPIWLRPIQSNAHARATMTSVKIVEMMCLH